ncbi:hypothetical protein BT69DRAFT_1157551 [Atractiella rhizophila]|nr:hypothetical protein BT69DRAFT_1157551 [Atractiella rhizophila]
MLPIRHSFSGTVSRCRARSAVPSTTCRRVPAPLPRLVYAQLPRHRFSSSSSSSAPSAPSHTSPAPPETRATSTQEKGDGQDVKSWTDNFALSKRFPDLSRLLQRAGPEKRYLFIAGGLFLLIDFAKTDMPIRL